MVNFLKKLTTFPLDLLCSFPHLLFANNRSFSFQSTFYLSIDVLRINADPMDPIMLKELLQRESSIPWFPGFLQCHGADRPYVRRTSLSHGIRKREQSILRNRNTNSL